MHAEGTAMDGKEKRRRAKCTSAETKQSKQKLTWSQIIKSNKNKRENVTVCSCSTWGGSNCLCSVAFCILNVSYSFGVSSSKGFPPAQTASKVPQVTTDWQRRLEEGLVSEHTHFSPNYIDCPYLYPQKMLIVSLLAKTLAHLQATYLCVESHFGTAENTNPLWDKRGRRYWEPGHIHLTTAAMFLIWSNQTIVKDLTCLCNRK